MTQRTREDIMKNMMTSIDPSDIVSQSKYVVLLEVLLDIRDLLTTHNK